MLRCRHRSVVDGLVAQGLTENQNRLLYMLSLYTHKADTRGEKDHWLRKPALVVLLYEGIVANVLDFDYAPQSELIENRRIWMNVSQVNRGHDREVATPRSTSALRKATFVRDL